MRVIKPSFEVWDRSIDPLVLIQRAGKVCYQLEVTETPEEFVRKILKRKPPHGSVLEHAWFAVKGYQPWPMPPFMEWDAGGQLLLGNARAW